MTFLYYRTGSVTPLRPWNARHQPVGSVAWVWGTKRRAYQRAQLKRLKQWRREL